MWKVPKHFENNSNFASAKSSNLNFKPKHSHSKINYPRRAKLKKKRRR